MTDSVPAPMVQIPAETVEQLREALDQIPAAPVEREGLYPTLYWAARAVVDAASPAASVPAADELEIIRRATAGPIGLEAIRSLMERREQAIRHEAYAAGARDAHEQADKGEATDTPGVSHTNANVEGCVTCRNIQELGCMCGPNGCECPAPAAPPEPLREQIAAEIEKQGRAVVEWLAAHKSDDLDMGRLIGTEDAYKDAVRIAREEKFDLADLAARVPVNDEAEAAWQAYKAHPVPDDYRANRKSFLAGFRAARGGGNSDE